MSSRSTVWPSLRQTYCCFRREPHPLCNRLKEMEFDVWVAVYNLTGIATRPSEIVRDPMERMAMRGTFATGAGRFLEAWDSLSAFTSEGFRKALFRRENIMPPVPGFFQAREHISQC